MDGALNIDVPQIVQLAIAPVFLIAGIGNLLNVLTSRLARVVDRGRVVAAAMDGAVSQDERDSWRPEMAGIDRRVRLINLAITLSTVAMLLVCLLISAMFLGEIARLDFTIPVVVLFVATMIALIAALLAFLAEVRTATRLLAIPTRLLKGG
ncbi:MAG: DUF2721 domain-containing protein [Hyphomonadaceae bacterium]|jgi:lysylphosphatidylglycerol synthetase-like protein (DUF2156 family)|nr:DUF2721 domain-containing protein [Hyphomonadaceae bacterium]